MFFLKSTVISKAKPQVCAAPGCGSHIFETCTHPGCPEQDVGIGILSFISAEPKPPPSALWAPGCPPGGLGGCLSPPNSPRICFPLDSRRGSAPGGDGVGAFRTLSRATPLALSLVKTATRICQSPSLCRERPGLLALSSASPPHEFPHHSYFLCGKTSCRDRTGPGRVLSGRTGSQ